MLEVIKKRAISFKMSCACTQCPQPCSRPPPTHASARDSWTLTVKSGSLLLSLGPGAHKFLFVFSKSLFPQSYVSSGSSLVGLMVTSSKRAYATPRSAAPRVPAPAAGHYRPIPPHKILKYSKAGLAQYLWGFLVSTKFCLSPLSVSGRYGV